MKHYQANFRTAESVGVGHLLTLFLDIVCCLKDLLRPVAVSESLWGHLIVDIEGIHDKIPLRRQYLGVVLAGNLIEKRTEDDSGWKIVSIT